MTFFCCETPPGQKLRIGAGAAPGKSIWSWWRQQVSSAFFYFVIFYFVIIYISNL
jgi:hypothetical protein